MDKKILLDVSRQIFEYVLKLDDKDIMALYNKEKKLALIEDKLQDNFQGEKKVHHGIIGPGPVEKNKIEHIMPVPSKNSEKLEKPPVPDDIKGRFKIKPLDGKEDHHIEGPLKKHPDPELVKKHETDVDRKSPVSDEEKKKADILKYAEKIFKKLNLFQSREEAYVYLKHDKKITIAVLKEAAKMGNIYIKSKSTKSDIIEKIVESVIGSKADRNI